ncbi:P-loop NTPase fold protein [Amycolatopsis sp. CA-230715]|uniref:P-loop NTPase fold protein n=1 Tax=Amycolatopsis sp. CA-230715 TaxID=2745196 RepID=UPI001C013FAA|nr:P-loop NTPase fold protein [Amycolatopsis sp. CA-230715]
MTGPVFDADGYTLDDDVAARQFVVLNDTPLGEGTETDLLETNQVARGLAELIIASRTTAPFTLAVDAAWGMGKSSLLRTLEKRLAAEPAVSVVWFNAWTSGAASALEGLIKSVLLRFDRNLIRRAVRSVTGRAHLVGLLRGTALLVGSAFGIGKVVNELWQALAVDARSRNQLKGVLRDLFTTWIAKGDRTGGQRLLVVFVDDLDRCAGERVVEVCEAIKLYLDVPGVVFVLACDQTVLWRAVQDSAGNGEPARAVEYLEKIVQINYRIPPPSTVLAAQLVDGYLRQSETANLFDSSMRNMIVDRTGRNPRRIKRLINSFVLEYHLDRSWDDFGPENLVKLVLLQHFYPAFYGLMADPRELEPVQEFLAYQKFHGMVRQGAYQDPERWRQLFLAKGIRPPERTPSADELSTHLRELEHELPDEFPVLAADRDFVELVKSLNRSLGPDQFRLLLRKPLTGGPAHSPFLPPAPQHLAESPLVHSPRVPLAETSDPARLPGFRVLWIDDHPGSNRRLIDHLTRLGAVVTTAVNHTAALAAFEETAFSIVLSDLTHGADPEKGLTDLAHYREHGIYHGPVIFCSGKASPEIPDRAARLGALGPTNDENEIMRWISLVASGTLSPPLPPDEAS